jgi:hypothetical protein
VTGPDPLGKRALFWMPVDEEASEDEGPARPHARPAGRHALFSTPTPAQEGDPALAGGSGSDPLPARGLLTVSCSSCGSVSRVGLFEFLLLQLPWAGWLPGRVFDRWMTCPACRRRTWTSVTLSR